MNGKYEIKEENTLAVCMFCYPGASILDAIPELRHRFTARDISHGTCKPCQLKWIASIKADQEAEKRAQDQARARLECLTVS
jgi:hypothetical protein